ncbi:MAG: YdiU family protein [Gammaproteobacteria bacterium]|nr:YdiU family protein [Gammaproteobacteria bacterium]
MNAQLQPAPLEGLQFDNRFIRALPGDEVKNNYRRQVIDACYSKVHPARVPAPQLVAYSREVSALIGMDCAPLQAGDEHSLRTFTQVFAGNELLAGMEPYACCYGGHQFGSWAGQLGDGRAINLGEVKTATGEHWTLQLKGAGPTPYSRTADGLAVLRSSVREFLCSEAMHHLGVPTTRALSLVTTGEQVIRDMFYDGNPRAEPGAVVCRVAPSFTRFGNFEVLAARDDTELLRKLMDYTITSDFPQLGEPKHETYIAWFDEVCRRTALMVAHWMRVGFVHGVMNTDNMSILGLTIDYGPYGWLEDFDPDWTPNTTDAGGKRYRFGHQPHIAQWNLLQLANAIYPVIDATDPLEQALSDYVQHFDQANRRMMAAKLGVRSLAGDEGEALIQSTYKALRAAETDMTPFYRNLPHVDMDHAPAVSDRDLIAPLMDAYYAPDALSDEQIHTMAEFLRTLSARVREDNLPASERAALMNSANPKYVLRNYLAQLAIDKAEGGDYSMVGELLEVLRHPYEEQVNAAHFAAKRPEWARVRPGCSMLSCSS